MKTFLKYTTIGKLKSKIYYQALTFSHGPFLYDKKILCWLKSHLQILDFEISIKIYALKHTVHTR
jgi:hypothetical protein